MQYEEGQVLFASSATLSDAFPPCPWGLFKTGDAFKEKQNLIQEEYSQLQIKTIADWILQNFQRQAIPNWRDLLLLTYPVAPTCLEDS